MVMVRVVRVMIMIRKLEFLGNETLRNEILPNGILPNVIPPNEPEPYFHL